MRMRQGLSSLIPAVLAMLCLSAGGGLGCQVQSSRRLPRYRSGITIYDLKDQTTRTRYAADELWEAPNWTPDGKYLLANSGGAIYRIPVHGAGPVTPEKLSLDAAYFCNNDHAPSPDGKLLAFSASSPSSRRSQVFVASADGRNARLITPKAPSYFHGWSPDGRWLTFVAQREASFDIYRVPAAGGEEERLTSHGGYDDGSEYSPDGQWMYFNSGRFGGWPTNHGIWSWGNEIVVGFSAAHFHVRFSNPLRYS